MQRNEPASAVLDVIGDALVHRVDPRDGNVLGAVADIVEPTVDAVGLKLVQDAKEPVIKNKMP